MTDKIAEWLRRPGAEEQARETERKLLQPGPVGVRGYNEREEAIKSGRLIVTPSGDIWNFGKSSTKICEQIPTGPCGALLCGVCELQIAGRTVKTRPCSRDEGCPLFDAAHKPPYCEWCEGPCECGSEAPIEAMVCEDCTLDGECTGRCDPDEPRRFRRRAWL